MVDYDSSSARLHGQGRSHRMGMEEGETLVTGEEQQVRAVLDSMAESLS